MSVDETMKSEAVKGNHMTGIVAAVAGWLVPGLGHLVLRRWSKAAVYFLCVGGLACAGLAMRGGIFGAGGADLFDRLGFFADLGAGVFYFLAHQIQTAGPDVAHATGDYGTRLFAAAGMLNLLTVLEAYDIGRGGEAK
ncbi:MAG TPA: DUF6677 family protein [Candidatus Acidoferrales bacterium]|jgi:hypothetical protein|nr:DUF6677 family protein [Candidatus Acidoferrales bacterium]